MMRKNDEDLNTYHCAQSRPKIVMEAEQFANWVMAIWTQSDDTYVAIGQQAKSLLISHVSHDN